MVTTLIGESVVAKMMYRNCPIMLPSRVTSVELVELDMVDFLISFWGWIGCMIVLLSLIV